MQQEFSQLFLQMSPYQAIMLIINSTTNVSTVTTRISYHRYLSYKDIFLVPFKKQKKNNSSNSAVSTLLIRIIQRESKSFCSLFDN